MLCEKMIGSFHGTTTGTAVTALAAAFAASIASTVFAQDECSTAIVIQTAATTSVNTAGMTPSASVPVDTFCGATQLNWTATSPDVWFKWVAPAKGVATFNTCTASTTAIDTSIALYTGACGSLVQVACNGDMQHNSPGGCNTTDAKIANFAVTAGTTYFIRVAGIESPGVSASGVGQLTITLNRVSAWGDNFNNVCDIPANLGIPTKLVAGDSHALAIREDGSLVGWGSNSVLQLNIPAGLTAARDIAAGSGYSLAIRSNGTVVGWGSNTSTRATPPATIVDAVAVAAGGLHGLVVRATGAVQAWGAGTTNTGLLPNYGQSIVPAAAAGSTDVSAGTYHSVALRSTGTVVAWGAGTATTGTNQYGQSIVPGGLSGVTKIASGNHHNLALRSDGTVVAWGAGSNNTGALPHYGQSIVPAGAVGVIDIAAGGYHSLALKSDGTIVAWGLGTDYQTTLPDGMGPAALIAAGGRVSLAIFDGCLAEPGAGDCLDLCPNDPNKTEPGQCGCGVPDTDSDGDGVADCSDGCPSNAQLTAPVAYFIDADHDGFGSTTQGSACSLTPPAGFATNSSDCNDAILTYADNDGDGYGAGAITACGVALSTDCNDADAAISPGASEICDALNVDENCSGAADNLDPSALASSKSNFYADADGDGHTVAAATRFCDIVAGYLPAVSTPADCNDANPAINPNATEVCDALNTDENCSGAADNLDASALASTMSNFYADADNDTYTVAAATRFCDLAAGFRSAVSAQTDCDDASAAIHPGAIENCANDGIDNNCNGASTAAEAIDALSYCADADNDGFGAGAIVKSCTAIAGHVTNGLDCNDGSAAIHPGATENCANDGTDNNCDGSNLPADAIDATSYCADADGDGFGAGAIVRSCTALAGHVTNGIDCNDAQLQYADADGDGHGAGSPVACGVATNDDHCPDQALLLDPATFYADTDGDGAGDAAVTQSACVQPVGFVPAAGDTCPGNAALLAPITYYADLDNDGVGDAASTTSVCQASAPAGFVSTTGDLCPNNAALVAPATFYADIDGDGAGDAASTQSACAQPDGFVAVAGDACPSEAALTAPRTFYADTDNDGAGDPSSSTSACSTTPPAGFAASANDLCPANGGLIAPLSYFADTDGDGFGNAASTAAFCSTSAPAGFAADSTDCNDALTTYADADGDGHGAGAPAACGVATNDDQCPDNAQLLDPATYYADLDGDGHGDPAATQSACAQPAGFVTVAGDTCPNNPALLAPVTYYADADNDGAGDPAATQSACAQPAGFVTVAGDACPTNAALVAPNTFYADTDNDGAGDAASPSSVCSVSAPAGYAANPNDQCPDNGGLTAPVTYYADADADGFGNLAAPLASCGTGTPPGHATNSTDCNDALVTYADADGDGFGAGAATACGVAAAGDCNDGNPAVRPNASESCNSIDDDCDGTVDEDLTYVDYFVDGDGDGFGAGAAISACSPVAGRIAVGGDCNDAALLYADADGDGHGAGAPVACGVTSNDDGCPDNAALLAPATFYADADNDGAGDAAVTQAACALPVGYVTVAGDACPANGQLQQTRTYHRDADNDGFGSASSTTAVCETIAPIGFVTDSSDCNDAALLYADADGDGHGAGPAIACGVATNDDACPELNALVARATYYADADNDGFGAVATITAVCSLSAPAGFVIDSTDCNDAALLYADADGDGFGAGAAVACGVASSNDCAPANAAINPGAVEICDASDTDENCNSVADNADAGASDATKSAFYADADGDTYTVSTATRFCDIVAGYRAAVSAQIDCNDAVSAINPGATEVCDSANTDENCNGTADNADATASDATKSNFYLDADSDTYTVAAATRFCDIVELYRAQASAQIDCNDAVSTINPGMTELCDAANVDENCNNVSDNADATASDATKSNFYMDADGDTYTVATATRFCDIVDLYRAQVSAEIDCNDSVSTINPGMTEVCDAANTDENCNGTADNADATAADAGKSNFYLDADSDTYTVAAATRFCDIVELYRAQVSAQIDCNDSVGTINPGMTELCDAANIDENCNSVSDNADAGAAEATKSNFYLDADSDTYTVAAATRFCDIVDLYRPQVSAEIDCNDAVSTINPGMTELCDAANVDENCNNVSDNADAGADEATKSDFYLDADSDTYTVSSATRFCDIVDLYRAQVSAQIDCNDSDSSINPGMTEVCDAANTDENCNGTADNADATADDAGKSNFYLDADSDTYTVSSATRFCDIVDLYRPQVSAEIDCNDSVGTINPGMTELCDAANVDENCNNVSDNADAGADETTKSNFYLDADSDNYTVAAATRFCDIVELYRAQVSAQIDCNDSVGTINPGMTELCDAANVDENCNNVSDNADATASDATKSNFYLDADGDTYTVATATRFCDIVDLYRPQVSAEIDCNDAVSSINPGMTEVCDAANTDENCNGTADNADATADDAGKSNFYLDADSDTYTVSSATRFCDIVDLYRPQVSAEIDCNDSVGTINPGMTELCDAANVDENCNNVSDNADAGADEATKSNFYLDADSDTYTVSSATRFCDIVDLYRAQVSAEIDCNDSVSTINPGVTEICDAANTDENCNGTADNADATASDATKSNFYMDADGDTYTVATATRFCDIVDLYRAQVSAQIDCNDAVSSINPGMTEVCDAANTDENCNGTADNADATADDAGKSNFYLDADSDTYTVSSPNRFCDIVDLYRPQVSAEIDCNDSVGTINPGMTELCDAANVDEDCNNVSDNADAGADEATKSDFYLDADSDTYTVSSATRFCDIVDLYRAQVSAEIDCNDAASAINPGATEICDAANTDENCNSVSDNADATTADAGKSNFYLDADGDTYTVAAATRFCDIVDLYRAQVSAQIDCDDNAVAVNPGMVELCDLANVDEDCNGVSDNNDSSAVESTKSNFFLDADNDMCTVAEPSRFCDIKPLYRAAVSAAIDCNDQVATINPEMTELCDAANVDENCNGLSDNADASASDASKSDFFLDADGDTYTVATATRFCDIVDLYRAQVSAEIDCNDSVSTINPGMTELCDAANVDENCNNLSDNADAGADEATKTDFYLDADSDTYTVATATRFCDIVDLYRAQVSAEIDCNDSVSTINPGMTELCDAANVDENCNNLSDNADAGADEATKADFFLDADNDTYTVAAATRFCDIVDLYRPQVSAEIDCNDSVSTINPGMTELCDAANVDENCNNLSDNADAGADEATKSEFFLDADSDTYTVASATRFCDIVDLYRAQVSAEIDCNDSVSTINPGMTELCDAANVDENCNNLSDNADAGADEATKADFFLDADNDTYTVAAATRFCDIVELYRPQVSAEIDCNDSVSTINPGMTELCDAANVDENCNNLSDNADAGADEATKSEFFLDADSDTYTVASATRFCDIVDLYRAQVSAQIDCNDSVSTINPGMTELCDAANIDENCNNLSDNADAGADEATKSDFFLDADSDTYTVASATRFCDIVDLYRAQVSAEIDCNDSVGTINPGMTELCDAANIDENCNNLSDNADAAADEATKSDFFLDADSDTYTVAAATRFCDIVDLYRAQVSAEIDCNDSVSTINPGMTELCDAANVDENCNNLSDNADTAADEATKSDFFLDADSDTYTVASATRFCDIVDLYRAQVSAEIDCNDSVSTINPGMTELCDAANIDENCNAVSDNADAGADEATKADFFLDADSDTYTVAAATRFCDIVDLYRPQVSAEIDCNDSVSTINPGMTELCDTANIDENCNAVSDNADAGADEATKSDFFLDADSDTYTVATATRFCDIVDLYRPQVSAEIDCNDSVSTINPGMTELCDAANVDENCNNLSDNADAGADEATKSDFFLDADSDTYTVSSATRFCDIVNLYRPQVSAEIDCNDSVSTINPGMTELCDAANIDENCNAVSDNADAGADEATKSDFFLDADNDTYTVATATRFCDIVDLYRPQVSAEIDCDDLSALAYPGAVELCATVGVDNNCDARIDDVDTDAADKIDFFRDADRDGFSIAETARFCPGTDNIGYLAAASAAVDCDDAAAMTYPGAVELCATVGVDNNCDARLDDVDGGAADKVDYFRDADLDGFSIAETARFCPGTDNIGYLATASASVDCDDAAAATYPGAVENCGNLGVDNDCNGSSAESEAIDRETFYADVDGDGAGDATVSTLACAAPVGYVLDSSDLCPGNAALLSPVTYYADADADGAGDANAPLVSCESNPPAGYSSTSTDGCPADAGKLAPGTCGCGVPDVNTDGDLKLDCEDNCPLVANDDQANCDGDTQGNACDADDDNDGAVDQNDAYSCDAGKSDVGAGFTPDEIRAFLAGASAATVDATGMTVDQLRAVIDGVAHVADRGIGGEFTLTGALTSAELGTILGKAAPATGFVGGATITIDASGMSLGQLGAVASHIGAVTAIVDLSIDSTFAPTLIEALVSKTAPGAASVSATGMTTAQLAACVSGPSAVAISGAVVLDASLTAEQLAEIVGSVVTGTTISVDSSGMSAAQQGALLNTASLIVDADAALALGETFTVYIDIANLPQRAVGIQACVSFNPQLLEYVPTGDISGVDFPSSIFAQQSGSSVIFSTGIAFGGDHTGITQGNVARLTFRALQPLCGATNLVWLTPAGFNHVISSEAPAGGTSTPIPFSVINRATVSALDAVAFSGLPTGATVTPADAGTVLGAVIAQPVVTASSQCGPLTVSLHVEFPAASGLPAVESWPAHFPVGVSTVTWSIASPGGSISSESRAFEVLPYQLATIEARLAGTVSAHPFTLPLRVRLSTGEVVATEMDFNGAVGIARDIQVPVHDAYTCMSLKDAEHTLASSREMFVDGTRYILASPFVLVGGDSNDDNNIDVLDFGAFVTDRGTLKNERSRSNFNRDTQVNNADIGFISINFLHTGDSCASGFDGTAPLERVKVKDLRRAGLGSMEAADINGDGWIDSTDIGLAIQGVYRRDGSIRENTAADPSGRRW